ncbi:MAG: hypothetical protein JSU08_15080 [Acidobacteria bacterium]|nr:hypothetical protein [Acidobacteriota bacterium]
MAAVSLLAARAAFAPAHGLRAEYFASDRIDGTPALTGIDPSPSTAAIQHQWRASSPRVFAARWYGFLVIDRRDRYTFTLTSDDGAVLQVDGRTAVDNGGRHGLQTQAAALELDPGPHAIAVTFVQYGGTFALDLQLARGGEPAANVPPWRFTPEKTSPTTARAWRLVEVTAQWLLFVTMLLIPALAWTWRDRLIAHPHLSALALFAVLAVIHTWPLASDLAHLTRHDNRDSMLNEWIIGWVAHELPRNPLHLFDGNVFYPERHTLAYSEPMIVQAVMALPLLWAGLPLVATYNVLLIAGMALSGWTMAIVIRRWTGTWAAGLIAGSIYAFNAHTLSRIPHLQAQHVEFLPLALLAFDRLLEVPTARSAVRLAGWFILQGLTSVYLLVFSTFALAGAAVARVTALRRHPLFTLQALGIAAAVSVAALVPFLLPYGWVSRELHIVRSLGDAENFAASWPAYLTTPARIHASWSAQFADGNVLFPGALGLLLAAVAVFSGTAFRDGRARMALVVGAMGVALSFGSKLPGYATLYSILPLLQGIRATARFGWLASLSVAMLAGFGFVAVRARVPRRWHPALTVAMVAVAALESLAAPLGLARFEGLAPIYARVPRTPGTVVIELPFLPPRSVQFNAHYMLNSTANWQPLVNGYSGLQPPSYYRNFDALEHFPDDRSVAHLRSLGVTHVFVHEDQLGDEDLERLRRRTDLQRIDGFGAIGMYRVTR